MENMDCESPANSVSENEGAPSKKPKNAKVAKVKPMVRASTSKGNRGPTGPLTPLDQNVMDVRENESSESSLEIDEETSMLLADLESDSDKENREQAAANAVHFAELNYQMNVDDISQTEIEYLIQLENGGVVSPRMEEAFRNYRAECNQVNVTSLSDTAETEWNSVEEVNVKNKKKTTPQKLKRSRSLKQRSNIMCDTSDDSDLADRENESVPVKHKPLRIKKSRPSTSGTVSKVRNTPAEEYDDEADDEPEFIEEPKEPNVQKKKSARLNRIIMQNDRNVNGNKAGDTVAENGDVSDVTVEKKAAISLMAELSEKLIAQMQALEDDPDRDEDDIFEEMEGGFQSNDCNEFSEVLHIDNVDEDLAVPGCSKTPDQPPRKLSVTGYDSGSDFDQPGPSKMPNKRARKPCSPVTTDSETDGEDGSIQATRKANKKRMRQLMKKFRSEQLENQLTSQQRKGKSLKKGKAPLKRKRGSKDGDSSYKFHGSIPTEKRRSSRLQKKNPEYNYEALDEVQETLKHIYFKRPNYNLDDYLPEQLDDLEEVVHKPKRKSIRKKVEEHVIIPVENVTQEMLDNIAVRVKGKVYSADGTTCHQCRQKTNDQKTCCRNPDCSGMLGMFCGVCIKNRYGENAADALLNPNWICPVCRGKCNCSICRTKQGKRPTGILAPLAQQNGYKSVDHFLDNLKGEGDRKKDDHKYKFKRDPEAVLGFSNNGNKVHLQDGSCHFLDCNFCALLACDNPNNLLGFSKDGNYAIMGGHREEPLFKPKTYFFSLLRLKHT